MKLMLRPIPKLSQIPKLFKKKLSAGAVRIFSDQTRAQRDYFLQLKYNLQQLGDINKKIKFINGILRIMSKKTSILPKN